VPPDRARHAVGYACAMAVATVRRAVDADVDALVRIQSDTWRAAYAQLVPADALAGLTGPSARAAWRAAVGAGDRHHVFVAEEGEWTVGFCAAAHWLADDGTELAEVTTLLVEPRWGRRGHGGRLLAAAAGALRGHGAQMGHTWVPEADAVSRAFYGHAGWDADGPVRGLDTGAGVLREVRLSGPLDLRLR
jgi:GNAT superfamily N-acetyltransferase